MLHSKSHIPTTAMRVAQAEDSNLLKKHIVEYLPFDLAKESVMPPIVGKDKVTMVGTISGLRERFAL